MKDLLKFLRIGLAKISENLAGLLIFVLSCGLILSIIWPDFSFSQTENRTLAKFPAMQADDLWDGDFGEEAESYAQDQFPGRDLFFHLNYIFRKAAGQSKINEVYLGHRQLFSAPDNLSSEILDSNITAFNNMAASTGIQTSVLIAPDAASIQKENLPYQATFIDQVNEINRISGSMTSASLISINDQLLSNKDQPLYYKTDHHWTSDTAGMAAMTFCEQVHPDFGMNMDQFDSFTISRSFIGTLASASGSCFLKDEIKIRPWSNQKENPYVVKWADGSKSTSIYQVDKLNQKDQYQVFLGANQSIVTIDTMADNDRNLLLIKDSYANSMIQFLLPYYRSITIVDPRYCMDELSKLINRNGINEILAVYSCETLMSDSSLSTMAAEFESEPVEEAPEVQNSEESVQVNESESAFENGIDQEQENSDESTENPTAKAADLTDAQSE